MRLKIEIDNKTYEAEVDVLDDDLGSPSSYQARNFSLPAASSSAPAASSMASVPQASTSDEKKIVRSPIVGIVVQIPAQVGQEIKVDDTLLIIEAMKMESRITSPSAGKVKSIFAVQGAGVKAGQVVVEFE